MKTLIKTKLLEGKYAEVREYEMFRDELKLIHCTDKDYKNHDHSEDQVMFLSIAQQKKGIVVNTLQSKFPPFSYYRMYKFLWKPYQKSLDQKVENVAVSMSKFAAGKDWEKLREKLHQ